MKRFLVALFLLAVTGSFSMSAQSLTVFLGNGGTLSADLANAKITFGSNSTMTLWNGTSESTVSINNVTKITFDLTTSMPTVANFGANQLSIFPNPAVDVIRLQGLPMGVSVVSIYRLDGMLVFSGEVDAKSPMLNVGGLAAGSYLVRANGLTSKLVKR